MHPDPARRFDNSLDFVQSLERSIKSGLTDAEAHARHQEQIRRWHEAEELVRQEAVETARQEALEQARREIQERARLEAELAFQLQSDIEGEHPQPLQPSRLHRSPRRIKPWLWTLIALAALLILFAGGYRLFNDLTSPGGSLPTASESSETSEASETSAVSHPGHP